MPKKISSRIEAFLLEIKRKNPRLGCRTAVNLVERRFLVKVSKSRVNLLWKEKGLSQPIGRPISIPKTFKTQLENIGFIFLLAADSYVGISAKLAEILRSSFPKETIPNLQKTLYALIYRSVFADKSFWTIKGYKTNYSKMLSIEHKIYDYSEEIASAIKQYILSQPEVSAIQIKRTDGKEFFLDAQMRSLTSANRTTSFFMPLPMVKNEIEAVFLRNKPLILFTIPGFSLYTQEVSDFIKGGQIDDAALEDFAGTEYFRLSKIEKELSFIIGLWPFQYKMPKNTKLTGGYKRLWFAPLRRGYLVGESGMSISQHFVSEGVMIRLIHIMQEERGRHLLTLATNMSRDKASDREAALLFMNRWPYIEDNATQYLALKGRQPIAPSHTFLQYQEPQPFFEYIFYLLKYYAQRYFLNEEKLPFDSTVLKFSGDIRHQNKAIYCNFFTPNDFKYIEELQAACRRVNEIGCFLAGNARLWLNTRLI